MIGKNSMKINCLKKGYFYSLPNVEDITDGDYTQAKRACYKDVVIKKLVDCYKICVQSNASLLADTFENFRNICLQICELDPDHFLSAPGLVWTAALKNTKVTLDLLTDINMLLLLEKGIRGGIYHSFY